MINIKFSPPDMSSLEIDEVVNTLKSGWITTGPKTKLLEKQVADYCDVKKAACLNSATACLELSLSLLNIGPGDQVITTAYTYTASCSVIKHVGATPILIDTAPNSFHMDYDALENAITEKTKAVIAVDIGGVMCDYDRIIEILERKKNLFSSDNSIHQAIGRIAVIADSAHSFGAEYKGQKCGSVADFTCFSFHAVKNFTTAEGGAVVWKSISGIFDEDIYKVYMLLSLHGQTKDALEKTANGQWEYDIVCLGRKCNMTDIAASIGLAQLKRYDSMLSRRREIINLYDEAFKDEPVTSLNHYSKGYISSGHLYMLKLDGKDEKFRNELIILLARNGVPTNVHYKPLPMHTAYKKMGFDIKNFPNAFNVYKNEITLPLHTLLTDEEVEYIIKTFKNCLHEIL